MRLRSKILLFVLPLIIAPLLVLGWTAYSQLLDSTQQRMLKQMSTVLDQFALFINSKEQTAIANIELFSNHSLIKQYALTNDEDERYSLLHSPVVSTFRSFQNAFPDYHEIRFLMPEGYEDARWVNDSIPNISDDESSSQIFIEMSNHKDNIYSTIQHNNDINLPFLYVSKRMVLHDPSIDPLGTKPSLRGYLAISISLEALQKQLNTIKIGQRGFLILVNSDHKVILQPENSDTYTPFTKSNKGNYPELPPEIQSALHYVNANGIKHITFNENGYFVEKRRLLNDVHLVALLPDIEVYHEGLGLSENITTITIFAIIVTSILVILGLRSVVLLPLNKLEIATHEISRGKLGKKIKVKSKDEIGKLARSFEDMSYRLQKSTEQMDYLANHDDLTGLPNRRMFKEYLHHTIAHAKRHQQKLAVLFLDLDDFKKINDSLGHNAGDQLLDEFADRLSLCTRKEDYVAHLDVDNKNQIVARLGGDEFILLLTDLNEPIFAATIAKRIIAALQKPFMLNGKKNFVGASIGISIYPDDAKTTEAMIKHSDIAMYHAKGSGKNNYQFFSEFMNTRISHQISLENKLRQAIEEDQFFLYYQPQVEVSSGKIVGLEALLRWRHPTEGLIPPTEFIPIAEQSGLIVPITEWVLNEATQQNLNWQKQGYEKIPVAVNISGIQVAQKDIIGILKQALITSQLDPKYLEVELTETYLISSDEDVIQTITSIRELGVLVSLDDFGTEYSSLNYLRHLPIQTLKIDRSFIIEISTDKNKTSTIISAIIAMAHALNLKVVAEGVEKLEQLEFLTKNNCDIIQGYIYSRPQSAEDIGKLLAHSYLPIPKDNYASDRNRPSSISPIITKHQDIS